MSTHWSTSSRIHHNGWFPGRTVGGVALILGPIVWFAGWLLRWIPAHMHMFPARQEAWFDAQPFDAPQELAQYQQHPALVTTAYAVFAVGAVLLFPAFMTLARMVATRSPGLAWWGALLIVIGLFARLYFIGVEQTAFQLTDKIGLAPATDFIMGSYQEIAYGPWRVAVWCAVGQYVGMTLLAIGAFRAQLFGVARAALLIYCGWSWVGVLKAVDSQPTSFPVDFALLCVALAPLGVQVLRGRIPMLSTHSTEAVGQVPPRRRIW